MQRRVVIPDFNPVAPASALCMKLEASVPAVVRGYVLVKVLLRPIDKWDVL